jgi:hypothetical protein
MEVEEDDEFAASDRRRRELATTYSMILMFGVLAYQEYRMNNGRGEKRKEVVEHRHNKRLRRRIFGPRRVFDYIQRARLNAFNTELAQTVANRREWMGLKDDLEWNRVQQALIRFKGNSSKTDWAGNIVE